MGSMRPIDCFDVAGSVASNESWAAIDRNGCGRRNRRPRVGFMTKPCSETPGTADRRVFSPPFDDPQRAMRIARVAAHMAWVDRRLAADEVSAAQGVAAVLGVEEAGAGLLSGGPLPAVAFESSALEAHAREVVYATALWIALADGVLAPTEREALASLARCLRLRPDERERIESLVWPWGGNAGGWERRYAEILEALQRV
jgi:hypothetical protein